MSTSALMSFGMTVSGFVLVLACMILIHFVSVLVFRGGRLTECDTVTQNVAVLTGTLFFAHAMRETSERLLHRAGLPASHLLVLRLRQRCQRTRTWSFWSPKRAWSRYPSSHCVCGWCSSSQFAWDGATQRSSTRSPLCFSAATLKHIGMFWLCWEGIWLSPWFPSLLTKRCSYFASPSCSLWSISMAQLPGEHCRHDNQCGFFADSLHFWLKVLTNP